ncbi:class I SAM-dependent methyltransferase [Streptomyces oceani]|uniref:Methyltransferase n=1 Tax=Streptomyces oceani TaxID=1075402 RepID=A0A1E7JYG9_9ACTN|nr:class I SAM-dependent methyltransferase [Streptomyces oceani]OEU96646.1 methyltransferase [Streptomyces oceani]
MSDSTLRATQHHGTGPGAFTPDGCSVELYQRLPVGPGPGIVEAALPAGATLLELGAGAGRVTRPLLARGFRVTAVDESPEMLACVRETRTIHSTIEALTLEERFDAVLLASFLVNTADDELRHQILRACARHVAADGCVLVECENGWHATATAGWERTREDGTTVRLGSREQLAEGGATKRVRMEYTTADGEWSHTFLSRYLPEEELTEALAAVGLALERWLTEDHTWLRAVPA